MIYFAIKMDEDEGRLSLGLDQSWMRRSFESISISWNPLPIQYLQGWRSAPGLIIAR
jgi:hypothetical protein